MIPDSQLLYADYHVQVAYLNIVVYPAFPRINYAKPDADTLANLITKEKAI
ncbi:MAG: hypothetical protein H0W28_07080 [Pyrinomonadaceae bacterium]|jgi:hypothetical protein|nr:hypothetical protein [Pyrinomonadaceae bacterium]MDQ3173116.1 hypothetical protein [Acidobacteriota bacterium]